MPDLGSVVTFAIASVALLLIPGPAVVYILNRSVSDGRVLWEKTIGEAAVGGSGASGGAEVPANGTAGDFWASLQPFDIEIGRAHV